MRPAESHVPLEPKSSHGTANALTGAPPVHSRILQGRTAVAHHVRNLLSSVRGRARLLHPTTHGVETLGLLEVAEDASGACRALVDDELRPDTASGAEGPPKPDAGHAARRACDLVRGEAVLGGVEVAAEADERPPTAAVALTGPARVLPEPVRNAVDAARRPGLGLTPAASPVRRPGGAIDVESGKGAGATFGVRMPAT